MIDTRDTLSTNNILGKTDTVYYTRNKCIGVNIECYFKEGRVGLDYN